MIKVHREWTCGQLRRNVETWEKSKHDSGCKIEKKKVWKNITLFLLLFPSRTRLLGLTWAKGPGNNTLTPVVSDSSWPRGSRPRLQVRSDHLKFPPQPPHSSPAFASSHSHFLVMHLKAHSGTWQHCTYTQMQCFLQKFHKDTRDH